MNYVDSFYESIQTHKKQSIKITSRDINILNFILEMKFSTIEDIHSKFFKITRFGEESTSVRWARERIAGLIKLDLIKPLTQVCNKTLYIISKKGFSFLKNCLPNKVFCKPLLSVDIRTYIHDHTVIQIRNELEGCGLVTDWISERQLAELSSVNKHLSSEFQPDAIYTTPANHRIAFELEIALKAKSRYKEKIKRYVNLLRSSAVDLPFSHVHFVCAKDSVLGHLKRETELYQEYFKIETLSEFYQNTKLNK